MSASNVLTNLFHEFFNEFFSVWPVEKENKLVLAPNPVFFSVYQREKKYKYFLLIWQAAASRFEWPCFLHLACCTPYFGPNFLKFKILRKYQIDLLNYISGCRLIGWVCTFLIGFNEPKKWGKWQRSLHNKRKLGSAMVGHCYWLRSGLGGSVSLVMEFV